MRISIEQLEQIFKLYGDEVEIKYFNDIIIKGSCFLSTDIILADHLGRLAENDITDIEIYYEWRTYEILSKEFPIDFRKPFGRFNYTEMDRHLELLMQVNAGTRRKRYVYMVGDIYGVDAQRGGKFILIHHNEPMDYRKWNNLKRDLNRSQHFLYRNSEFKIIIFVDLTGDAHHGYVERFMVNADLISLLVSKAESEHNIASDFIPNDDVISVTDPSKLLEEYIRSNAKLIIIGEKLNESCKEALIEVKKYDKYVRMLVVPSLDHKNLDHFFTQVKLVYNYDRWV